MRALLPLLLTALLPVAAWAAPSRLTVTVQPAATLILRAPGLAVVQVSASSILTRIQRADVRHPDGAEACRDLAWLFPPQVSPGPPLYLIDTAGGIARITATPQGAALPSPSAGAPCRVVFEAPPRRPALGVAAW